MLSTAQFNFTQPSPRDIV